MKPTIRILITVTTLMLICGCDDEDRKYREWRANFEEKNARENANLVPYEQHDGTIVLLRPEDKAHRVATDRFYAESLQRSREASKRASEAANAAAVAERLKGIENAIRDETFERSLHDYPR